MEMETYQNFNVAKILNVKDYFNNLAIRNVG